MEINSLKNSQKAKPEEPKDIHPVVSAGSAKRVKQSSTSRIFGAVVNSDASDIRDHIVDDVVVPVVRNGLHSVFSSIVDSMFGVPSNNNSNSRMASPYDRRENYTGYSSLRGGSMYNQYGQNTNYQRPAAANIEYDQIVFRTIGDAQIVLDQMYDILTQYGIVTIADLIKLARLDDGSYVDNNWTDNNFGWKYIRPGVMPRYSVIKQGYILPLPQPIAID